MRQVIRRMWEIYAPFRWSLLGLLGFIFLGQGLGLLSPFLWGKVIDSLSKHQPTEGIIELMGAILVIFLFRSVVLMYLREKFEINRIDFQVPQHMARITMRKVLSFSIAQHTNQHSGIKQSIISAGNNAVTTMAYMIFYDVLPMVVELTLMILIFFYLDLVLGSIVFTGMGLFVLSRFWTNWSMQGKLKKLEEMFIENDRMRHEVLANTSLVIANAQEDRASGEFEDRLAKVGAFGKSVWLPFIRLATIGNTLIVLTRISVMSVGVYYVISGRYTVGYLVVFWSWSGTALGSVENFGNIQRQIMKLYASIKKYFELLDIEPAVKVIANPVHPEAFHGQVEFRNVTLRYSSRVYIVDDELVEASPDVPHPTEAALSNVNFTIMGGERVAIVGESGAGKTSIVNALLRAQDPDEGQILVDGHDLRILDLKQYRESVGLVEQYVPLFDHTVRYNITYGLNGKGHLVSDQELERIAGMTRIDRFFPRLEKGFNTVIGERGVKLSGGERQRVGIARALIKNPAILILDEATSNLDAENEALIQQALEEASKGRTTIIIAHRFSTIRNVDKVIVLARGKIVGIGTHSSLLAGCEEYARLVHHQLI